MDVFNCDLEAIEGSSLGDLDFFHETGCEVFKNDAIRGGEEGKDVGDEVLLVRGENGPVLEIL